MRKRPAKTIRKATRIAPPATPAIVPALQSGIGTPSMSSVSYSPVTRCPIAGKGPNDLFSRITKPGTPVLAGFCPVFRLAQDTGDSGGEMIPRRVNVPSSRSARMFGSCPASIISSTVRPSAPSNPSTIRRPPRSAGAAVVEEEEDGRAAVREERRSPATTIARKRGARSMGWA